MNTEKERFETMLMELETGKIKPSLVVGSGYKYPMKAAKEWLLKMISDCDKTEPPTLICVSNEKATYYYNGKIGTSEIQTDSKGLLFYWVGKPEYLPKEFQPKLITY